MQLLNTVEVFFSPPRYTGGWGDQLYLLAIEEFTTEDTEKEIRGFGGVTEFIIK
jgi:hypothetical protein